MPRRALLNWATVLGAAMLLWEGPQVTSHRHLSAIRIALVDGLRDPPVRLDGCIVLPTAWRGSRFADQRVDEDEPAAGLGQPEAISRAS